MYMFSWLQELCIWSINPVLYIHWVNMQLRLITNAVLWNIQLFDETNVSVWLFIQIKLVSSIKMKIIIPF